MNYAQNNNVPAIKMEGDGGSVMYKMQETSAMTDVNVILV